MAHAPYNFVGLPDNIMASPMDAFKAAIYGEDRTASRRAFQEYLKSNDCNLSGSIELDINNITSLFIGGNKDRFFAILDDDKPIIPGSSLRGLLHNLLKIVACGGIRDDEDIHGRHLYYRAIMALRNKLPWTVDLNANYRRQLQLDDKNPAAGVKPGFLLKDKFGDYRIYPYTGKVEKILIRKYEGTYKTKVQEREPKVVWQGTQVFCITGTLGMGTEKNIQTDKEYKQKLDYIKVITPEKAQPREILRQLGKQYIRYFDIAETRWENSYVVPESVLQGYMDDIKRNGVDLLKSMKPVDAPDFQNINFPEGAVSVVPCFFVAEGEAVKFFGHGKSFRVPYDHSIMDAVPAALTLDRIDFAEAIFGKKEHFAGRVFFEDAHLQGEAHFEETARTKPLLTPNPTSYQLYLEQGNGLNQWSHWDSPAAKIRGYKMYWHHGTADWRDDGSNGNTSIADKITPLKPGGSFKGRIRFKNLSRVELGALLAVLDIAYTAGNIGANADIVYKLGHGKSLGLGSVRIHPVLQLETGDAYERLFEGGSWYSGQAEADLHEYIDVFREYIGQQSAAFKAAWELVMYDLCCMMDWGQTKRAGWQAETSYMPLTNFMDREKLPTARNIYQIPIQRG